MTEDTSTSQGPGCSISFTVILVVFAFAALLLFQLPPKLLTRAGLLVEAISIFLITPQLLGVQRLKRIRSIALAISGFVSVTGPSIASKGLLGERAKPSPFRYSVVYVVIGWFPTWLVFSVMRLPYVPDFPSNSAKLGWAFFQYSMLEVLILMSIFFVSSLYMFYIETVDPETYAAARKSSGDPAQMDTLLLMLAFFPSHFLIGLVNLFVALPATIMYRLANQGEVFLKSQSALVNALIPVGILLFIFGVVLQFIGTF